MSDDQILVIGITLVALLLCACFVIVAAIRARSRRDHARLRTEVQKSLLEKFSSSQDLAAFLASPGSQRFLGDLSWERRRADIKERILRSVRAGVVLSMIGLAFFVLAIADNERKVAVPGVLFLALGVGLLAAAAVSYRLGKAWGLTNGSAGDSAANAIDPIPSPNDVLS